ncbi:hypothetical protein RCL1_006922 [Eukaryota sp. TZLM3-RCL]
MQTYALLSSALSKVVYDVDTLLLLSFPVLPKVVYDVGTWFFSFLESPVAFEDSLSFQDEILSESLAASSVNNKFQILLVVFFNSWKKDLTVDGDIHPNPGPEHLYSALGSEWLNDATIVNFLSTLESLNISYIDPTVIVTLLDDWNRPSHHLKTNDDTRGGGGIHWSLLILVFFNGSPFFYFLNPWRHYNHDNYESYLTFKVAERIVERLSYVAPITCLFDFPRQSNNSDCGVFVCWYAFQATKCYELSPNFDLNNFLQFLNEGPLNVSEFLVLLEQNDIDKSTSLPDMEARLESLEDYKSRTRRSTTSNVPKKLARIEDVTVEPSPIFTLPSVQRSEHKKTSKRMYKRQTCNSLKKIAPSDLNPPLLLRTEIKHLVHRLQDGRRKRQFQKLPAPLVSLHSDQLSEMRNTFKPMIPKAETVPEPIVSIKDIQCLDNPQNLPTILSLDIETFDPTEVLQGIPRSLQAKNSAREAIRQQNRSKTFEQREADSEALVQNSRIIAMSCHFCFLDENNAYHRRSFQSYTNECARYNHDPNLEFNVQPVYYQSEHALLVSFMALLDQYKPSFICGHSVLPFDWPVIKNRCAHYGVHVFQRPNLLGDYQRYLTTRWMRVVEVDFNCVFVDTLLFARKNLTTVNGFSLANLTHILLDVTRPKIDSNNPFLLPNDVRSLAARVHRILIVNYFDSLYSLKLFLLFRRRKIIYPTYQVVKTTLHSVFKHSEIINSIDDLGIDTHSLRKHTSFCLNLFFEALYEQENLIWPKVDEQFITSLMGRLKYLSGINFNRNFPNVRSAVDPRLDSFVRGDPPYVEDSDWEGCNHILNKIVDAIPRFPEGFSRIPQYIAPVMVANLKTNIKTRYFQYIQRLRQVKSLFLESTRADLKTFVNIPNLNVWNNDIIQGLVNQYNITQIEATRIVNQVNQLTITTLNEFLRSTALINMLYPLNCDNLSYELKVDPERFLQPSLFISRYLELNGAKPFNVFPLTKTSIPTSFPIGTRTLRSLVFNALSDAEVRYLRSNSLLDLNETVVRYSPQQQNFFWTMFTHIGTGKFKKPGYSFNNIIHTDGFNCSIEFVRNEKKVGKVFKADSAEFKIQEIYINDVDPQDIRGRKIVACDPGKRD